jgi:hypothetical protein
MGYCLSCAQCPWTWILFLNSLFTIPIGPDRAQSSFSFPLILTRSCATVWEPPVSLSFSLSHTTTRARTRFYLFQLGNWTLRISVTLRVILCHGFQFSCHPESVFRGCDRFKIVSHCLLPPSHIILSRVCYATRQGIVWVLGFERIFSGQPLLHSHLQLFTTYNVFGRFLFKVTTLSHRYARWSVFCSSRMRTLLF